VTVGTAGATGLDGEGSLALIREYLREKRPGETVRVVPLSVVAASFKKNRLVDGGRS